MMTAWLLDGVPSTLPPGPSHFIGVAGLVLRRVSDAKGNENDFDYRNYEVLVIKEKHGPSVTMKDFWKLPGGLVDRSEDICVAAPREVLEETGIDTDFSKICAIQEIHNGNYFLEHIQTASLI